MKDEIKRKINKIIQKLVYRYRADSESYVRYLSSIGMKLGERVIFYSPTSTEIDIQNPHMVTMGNDVQITANVSILTHDFSWSVLKKKYGEVLGGVGEVRIGNNCFIGTGTTILKNTYIGDNVIIGANSLVSGKFPSDCVIAGSPAKVIMSLDEYHEKRRKAQVDEAKTIYKSYVARYKRNPDENVFNEYFWLYTNDKSNLSEMCKMQMRNCGNEKVSYDAFEHHKPEFDGFEAMISAFEKDSIEK